MPSTLLICPPSSPRRWVLLSLPFHSEEDFSRQVSWALLAEEVVVPGLAWSA